MAEAGGNENMNSSEMIAGGLEQCLAMYKVDLKHMNDEQLVEKKMGVGRSPLNMTAEVGFFNGACAKILKGEEAPMGDESAFAKLLDSFTTREEAVAMMDANTAELAEAIRGLSDEDLGAQVMAPWGEPITKGGLANMCVGHMMYHDGQINYIQTLNGDNAVHWMEL
jgi:hypothetical protein